jgi:glycosyltransferase involved in cell wall biosynthesis
MAYPPLSVIIPTYNRPWEVKRVIQGLKQNLRYSGKIRYWIGADGNTGAGKMFSGQHDITTLPGPNNGLGANLNRLIATTPDDYLFQLDDDHLLLKTINLDDHIAKLRDDETAGWVRLMGIGYHDYIANLEENYWRIWWQSPELYIPSNRPHLKHRRFHNHFGLYPEGLKLGETEEEFCKQCKAKKYGPAVLVPLDVLTEGGWDHIGESWQLKGE